MRKHPGALTNTLGSADLSRIPLTTSGLCVVCDKPAVRYDKRVSFCSARCQTERVNYPNGRPKGRNCCACGEWMDFTVVRPSGRRLKIDAVKCTKCRRNQQYPVTVFDLAERDGIDCSICTQPVDMTLKWPNRWAPTRDHVIPWSMGGGNEPENFALAHFRCNIQKRNKLDYVHPDTA